MRSTAARPAIWITTSTIAALFLGLAWIAWSAPASAADDTGAGDLAGAVQPAPQIPAAGTWTSQTAFPLTGLVRSWGVYYPLNGKFYALGGRESDIAGSDILSPLEYFPLGQVWAVRSATFADNQVDNMVGGVVNVGATDYIVLVGGSAAGATTASSETRTYEPFLDAMTTLLADPWPGNVGGTVLPGAAAVYNDKLYVFGGFNINVGMVSTIWRLDPLAAPGSRWQQMTATLPAPRGYIPTATSGNYIYGFGGSLWDGSTLQDSTDSWRYDPNTDTISTGVAAIPRATAETRAVTQFDGRIWVLGGGRTTPNPSTEVDIYDPASNSWSVGPPMITARRNFAADIDPATREILAVGGYAPTTASTVNEKYSALIFNNDFESGAICDWSNATQQYFPSLNRNAIMVLGSSDTGNHTDDGSTLVALPFSYQLYDSVFSNVNVGSNGHLTFGTVNNAFNPGCIPLATATYAIGPYWTDQCTAACLNATCTGCGIFSSTSGTAPHRIFNVEYRTRYYNSGGDGIPLNYEVRLFEGELRYEVVYDVVNTFTPPSARSLSTGVQLDNGAGNSTLFGCDSTGGSAPPVPPPGDSLIYRACGVP